MDRNENGIDACSGIGSAVDTGRTDRQRPSRRLVPKRSTADAALKTHLR